MMQAASGMPLVLRESRRAVSLFSSTCTGPSHGYSSSAKGRTKAFDYQNQKQSRLSSRRLHVLHEKQTSCSYTSRHFIASQHLNSKSRFVQPGKVRAMSSQIPSKMKVIDIKGGKGPISAMYINDDYPIPQPGPTQALVKIHSFGLNRMDLLQREGKYPLPPQAGPIMGVEFSGTILSFGSPDHGGEKDLKEGDAVFGLAYGGAYAEYIAVSTHMLVKKPRELSWEVAAGIPETWITATQALWMIGDFKEGDSVLWHAGASSVSIAGIQLSKANGASRVLVTASTEDKIEFCKTLGADAGFSYKDPTKPWDQQVLEYTGGKGVDVIIDFVGGSYFAGNLEAAARDGRIVNLASLGGVQIPDGSKVNFGNFVKKRLKLQGSSLRSRDEEYQGKLRNMLVEHALPKFIDGTFKVPIEKVFKFDQVQEAHELMESNKTKGKLIVNVEQ